MGVPGGHPSLRGKTRLLPADLPQPFQAVPDPLLYRPRRVPEGGVFPGKGGAVKVPAVLPKVRIVVVLVPVQLSNLIPAGEHGKSRHSGDDGVHHQIPLNAHGHLCLVPFVKSLFDAAEAGGGAAASGVLGLGIVVVPLPPGIGTGEAALKEGVQIPLDRKSVV